jgi:hypothetical protein
MMLLRALSGVVFTLGVAGSVPVAAQQPSKAGAPETFSASARAENADGAALSAPIGIHVNRYTPDFDRKRVEEGLRVNGYPGFITALRSAPDVGYVEVTRRRFTIRYAREVVSEKGRTIVVVTDKPVAFLGGGMTDSKPRAGYEVGAIELTIPGRGEATGRMVAAARIKAGGETGVLIDNYAADAPIVLTKITRQ